MSLCLVAPLSRSHSASLFFLFLFLPPPFSVSHFPLCICFVGSSHEYCTSLTKPFLRCQHHLFLLQSRPILTLHTELSMTSSFSQSPTKCKSLGAAAALASSVCPRIASWMSKQMFSSLSLPLTRGCVCEWERKSNSVCEWERKSNCVCACYVPSWNLAHSYKNEDSKICHYRDPSLQVI